ncbi:CGH_1_HP_G0103470.mRNA.1.CDS.1 [Saccharomyces cerevisiae]|nr:CGH_1_HP_G0103470.mRNA.1.CDS.1 [Saccharomyces cerevisiae]CAI6950626.1 CGH_1_HP_G0103470.mRNA.1.CDS.1 [Saccharomyces cerevisiae]
MTSRLKMRTASVADPILDAVQGAQPFEQAADTFHDNMNRQSYFFQRRRSCSYAVSGDPVWAQQLETPTYGFRVRPDFPVFGAAVTYDANGMPASGWCFQSNPQQHVQTEEKQKKKKKGLFGRMKKK